MTDMNYKRIIPLLLIPVALVGIAATTYTITQLTANNSPGDGTLIEIYDPSASPKSGKYVLTNLARATQAGITNSLGYVPVNKAGDTGIGALALSVAANSTPLTIGGYSLTGSAANSLLDLSGTWNTSGNPSALKLTITDTASGSNAKAIEVLGGAAGSTALFSIGKSGQALFSDGSAAAPGIAFSSSANSGFRINSGNVVFVSGGADIWSSAASNIKMRNNAQFGWSSTTDPTASPDTILLRDAANTLALRNGANAQAFRVYSTYTDASNYERLIVEKTSGQSYYTIGADQAGTGGANALLLRGNGNLYLRVGTGGAGSGWTVNSSGHFLASTDNSFDIGASGATRPRNVYVANDGTFGGSLVSMNNFTVGSSGQIIFGTRSKLRSGADGSIQLGNFANDNFSLLQFGGTTASFPAIKRSSAGFADVVADDSGPTYRLGSTLVSAKTADYSVAAADSRTTFTNEGTTANRNNTLPGAAAGLTYTFIVQDADGLTVTAAAGDTIRVAASVTSAAGNISATTIGNVVTLTAINATEWIATSVVGTWTISP